MRYFCTYFDRNYLPRGLALYRSLQRHCPAFQLWVLCMDRVCYDVLAKLGLAGVHPIALDEYEKGDEDLLRAKQNRTPIEYYFTCSPSLPLFVLDRHPQVQVAQPTLSSWGYKGYCEVWLEGSNDWIYRHLHAGADRMVELARENPDPTLVARAVPGMVLRPVRGRPLCRPEVPGRLAQPLSGRRCPTAQGR